MKRTTSLGESWTATDGSVTRPVEVGGGPVDEEGGPVTRFIQVGRGTAGKVGGAVTRFVQVGRGTAGKVGGAVTRPVQVRGGPVDEDGRPLEIERNSVTPLADVGGDPFEGEGRSGKVN